MYEQRSTFNVKICTHNQYIVGEIYLPPGLSTAAHLNTGTAGLLAVSRPLIYGLARAAHPAAAGDVSVSAGFIALHRDRIRWLVGGRPSEPLLERRTPQRAAFLYDHYLLVGELLLGEHIRLSDYLRSAEPFQLVSNAALYGWHKKEGRALLLGERLEKLYEAPSELGEDREVVELQPDELFDLVTVNLSQTHGIMEAHTVVESGRQFVVLKQSGNTP